MGPQQKQQTMTMIIFIVLIKRLLDDDHL